MTNVSLKCEVCGLTARRPLSVETGSHHFRHRPSLRALCPKGHGVMARIDGGRVKFCECPSDCGCVTCDLCKSEFAGTPGAQVHRRHCARKRQWEREYFKEHGKWPLKKQARGIQVIKKSRQGIQNRTKRRMGN